MATQDTLSQIAELLAMFGAPFSIILFHKEMVKKKHRKWEENKAHFMLESF